MLRYFCGHPVLYIITIMFFVALSSLGIKFLTVLRQKKSLRVERILEPRTGRKVDPKHADNYLAGLADYEKTYGKTLITARLTNALQFVRRCGSAEELDTELRYLADEDIAKADAEYGLVRLVLWAVPMLGFLGTVIGITMALGNLDLNAINESSQALSAGLMVAFDTTALAIALDLVLYFVQFLIYREESNLLWAIDKQVDNELRGRFEMQVSSEDNSQVVAVRRMFETVADSLRQLMGEQTKVWEQSFSAARTQYEQTTLQNAELLKSTLASAINENVSRHAESLVQGESQLLEKTRETAAKFNEALHQNASELLAFQQETARQTEAIQNIIGASNQLAQLEERLHQNLAALAQVGNFEETVNSLSAAIHLLNSRGHFVDLRRIGEENVLKTA